MKLVFYLLLCLSSVAGFAADMLADIQNPVTTPFGVYTPQLVTVRPDAPAIDPGANLENVANLADFDFSTVESQHLQNNHFFAKPAVRPDGRGYNEMFDIYNESRETGIPQFITTDAVLHGFHLMFDYILRTCEEERFIEQLDNLLMTMFGLAAEQYRQATDENVRAAIFRNMDMLLVASQLVVPKEYFVDPLPGGKYGEELALIYDATAQLVPSPIFGYPEDYTQYKPRGHYTKSEQLQQYFRAMMWLGRMTFSCEDVSEYSQTMTLSAILLTQTIAQVKMDNRTGLEMWDDIYQPTVFFVGKSDDITFNAYLHLCYNIYGKSFPIYPPDTFADEEKLLTFLLATNDWPAAQITYPEQPKKGLRFMGQRFVPDSWILDELVFNKIPNRLMPTGLDVMLVLGAKERAQDEWAFHYLSERDKNDPLYVDKLDSLKGVFRDYPAEVWAQNAYWNWLYCFMPLLMAKGDGYPFFMQTNAWRDKDLYAALASWAELRHDTILYAKQSGTERGVPPSAFEVQGYVEPNPHFYARIAALADFMKQGLESRQLLFPEFKTHLTLFAELVEQLKLIAEKELTDVPLSDRDYVVIFEFGKTLYDIVTFQKSIPSEGPQLGSADDLDPMPVIADVHYEANSGTVLEEAVGFPYEIYVICNIEGQPVIARGAGFSYYEFVQPATNRLTDEQWREMLAKSTHPATPGWASSFVVDPQKEAGAAEFYRWQKPGSVSVSIDMPKSWQAGLPLALEFSINDDWASDIPLVKIIRADAREILVTSVQRESEGSGWIARSETTGWPLGATFVQIEKGAGDNRLIWRSRFELTRTTQTDDNQKPLDFGLQQNYPNPFNPDTFIKISIPRAAFITLEVFDLRGRRVRTLVSSAQPAGEYIVPWDGLDDHGKPLSSGIYYYRMRADDFTDVKRLVLLR